MRKGAFVVPSLLAAGLLPTSTLAGDQNPALGEEKSLIDEIVEHAQSISELNEFSLAGHRSHQSHGSHGSHVSHSSHRSYHHPEPIPDQFTASPDAVYQTAAVDARNEYSTPRQNVLPRSPALAKKPRVLKGNSKKFAGIVARAQLALMSRSYDVGMVNGELHSKTIAALYKYQRESGLIPTGKLDNATLNTLGVVAN